MHHSAFGLHHAWWGLILFSVGFIALFHWPVPGFIVALLGAWIALDDLWQHFWQAVHNPNYHSPWHRWYWRALMWAISVTAARGWRWRVLMWMARH